MGETQDRAFQLSFNSSLKVDFQSSRVTSDGGLVLVRELDERFGLSATHGESRLDDSGAARISNCRWPICCASRLIAAWPAMRTSTTPRVCRRIPTFRLIDSGKIWERGAALTSRLQSFETEVLTQEENLHGLAALNRELIAKVEAIASS